MRGPALGMVALSVMGLSAAFAQTSQPSPSSKTDLPNLSNDRLQFELALTHKMLADELFIGNNPKDAATEYQAAKSELSNVAPNVFDVRSNDKSLLSDEIVYRQLLIQHELGFWGAAYLRRPIDPVVGYQRFQSTVIRLTKVVSRLDDLLDAAAGKAGTEFTPAEIGVIDKEKDADVAALSDQKAIVQQRYNGKQITMLSDRIQDIQKRQQEIAQQSNGLRNQLSSASAQMGALLAKGLSSAVGLPDLQSLQAVVKGQPLDKTLLTVADAVLLDGKSNLAQSIQEYSKTTADLVAAYHTARDAVADVNLVQRASGLLRARSTNDIIDIGSSMYASLDPDQQSKLAELVSSPDIKTVVNLANKGRALRDQVTQYISQSVDLSAEADPIITKMLTDQFPDFTDYYPQFLSRAFPQLGTPLQTQAFFDALLQNWSSVAADELFGTDMIAPLAAAMSITCADTIDCRNKIASQLAALGLKALPNAKYDGGRLQITINDKGRSHLLFDMPTQDVVSRLLKRQIDRTRDELAPKTERIIEQMRQIDGHFSDQLMAMLPDVSFDEHVQDLVERARVAKGQDTAQVGLAILNAGTPELRNKSVKEITSFMVGTTVAGRSAPAAPPGASGGVAPQLPSSPATGGDATGKMTEALALQALSMTGPYGAAIAVSVQLVTSIGQMNDLADKINKLNDEDTQLTRELLHLNQLIDEARLSDALADLDDRIAQRQWNAALAERDVLQTAFLNAAREQQKFIRRAKLLMPRLWLLADLARSQFEALDRSLSTWVGNPSQRTGQIEDAIRRDPNWARYALDNDIDLYSWLDRSVEGERTDIDRLGAHWEQLAELANSVCQRYKCDPKEALVNDYNSTRELSLLSLLTTTDQERLRQWQKDDNGPQSIDLPFFLTPKSNGMPDHLEGVRFADFSIAASTGTKEAQLDEAQLLHSGVGFVRVGDNYVQESFAPQVRSTLKYIVDPAKVSEYVEQLSSHWGQRPLRDVEGYPLYALYVLTIFRSEYTTLERMQDIKFRIFFSYRPNSSTVAQDSLASLLSRQGYWVQCDGATGGHLRLLIDDVVAVVPAKAAFDAGEQFRRVKLPGATNCHLETDMPR